LGGVKMFIEISEQLSNGNFRSRLILKEDIKTIIELDGEDKIGCKILLKNGENIHHLGLYNFIKQQIQVK
jgi:nitrogen fixation protein